MLLAGAHSRCAIERPKRALLFLVRRVDIVAVQNVLTEVLVNHTGVVAHPQLPQPRGSQQQVLIVDEGVGATTQALIVVPLCPVQTVQEWALSKLDQNLGWAWSSLLLTQCMTFALIPWPSTRLFLDPHS